MTEATLTPRQENLAAEIRRLCRKTHGKDHVIGWELVLFRACTGKAMLPSVDYGEMAQLLRWFIDLGGWVMQVEGKEKFIPRDEWARILRAFEGK